jgi:D-alanyl-D-alanine carboxypeptidase
MATNYLEVIAEPHSGTVNQGLSSPKVALMRSVLGDPRDSYTGDCQDPTNSRFKQMVATRSVGPLKATGLRPALDSLEVIFAQVKSELPDLHDILGSAGMLCCRFRRVGGRIVEIPSNHSWGTAIDIKLKGNLDKQGDDKCFRGLLVLSRYFNAARWFWGVTFPTEDAMHFEVSAELLRAWKKAGLV